MLGFVVRGLMSAWYCGDVSRLSGYRSCTGREADLRSLYVCPVTG
jgi:hypothetical protein